MSDPYIENPTEHLNEMRRTTKRIFTYGASEDLGLELANQFAELDTHLEEAGATPGQWRNVKRGRPRKTQDGDVLDTVKVHGKRTGYNMGCRCLKCTKANREHAALRAAQQRREL